MNPRVNKVLSFNKNNNKTGQWICLNVKKTEKEKVAAVTLSIKKNPTKLDTFGKNSY